MAEAGWVRQPRKTGPHGGAGYLSPLGGVAKLLYIIIPTGVRFRGGGGGGGLTGRAAELGHSNAQFAAIEHHAIARRHRLLRILLLLEAHKAEAAAQTSVPIPATHRRTQPLPPPPPRSPCRPPQPMPQPLARARQRLAAQGTGAHGRARRCGRALRGGVCVLTAADGCHQPRRICVAPSVSPGCGRGTGRQGGRWRTCGAEQKGGAARSLGGPSAAPHVGASGRAQTWRRWVPDPHGGCRM